MDDVWDDDASDDGLSREERVREERCFNRGYQEGLDRGKQDAVQRGFNGGFSAGISLGRQLGHVQGRIRALQAFAGKAPGSGEPAQQVWRLALVAVVYAVAAKRSCNCLLRALCTKLLLCTDHCAHQLLGFASICKKYQAIVVTQCSSANLARTAKTTLSCR